MRVLFDTGVFGHADFAEPAVLHESVLWGKDNVVMPVHGFRRKPPHSDADYQGQIDALFTVGRLIREGQIEAYEYREIECERMRGRMAFSFCHALQDCQIYGCPAALERSKFRQTINLRDALAKGGKKDRRNGVPLGSANQLAFFEWLCTIRKEHVPAFIQAASFIHLTEFEIESFSQLEWFQKACERSGSPENYPDVFHLWTAERNELDALLTLEKRLPNFVSRLSNEKAQKIMTKTAVLRPIDLLNKLGIQTPDPVPMEHGRFYYYHELRK